MHGGRAPLLAGRFELGTLLGSGGMGSVYLARDVAIGREVAIKRLPPGLTPTAEELAWQRDEATSLAALQHPNVVQLYDFVVTETEGAFLVMELVRGESLEDRLRRAEQLPVAEALEIALQILSALSAAHARGIVHRDVKPANVLLQPVPLRGDVVKVLDFGLAKLLEGPRARPATDDGTLLGTPAYMAPEQATASPVDGRTDLHAVGVCLYRMLTGESPFLAPDRLEILQRVIAHEPPRVDRLRPDVPAHVADAIARALAKSPAMRPASAAELAAALGAGTALPGRTMSMSQAPAPLRPSRPAPRGAHSPSRGRVFATSVVASVLVLAGFGAALAFAFRLGRASRPGVTGAEASAPAHEGPEAGAVPVTEDAGEPAEPVAPPTASASAKPPARAGTCACLPLQGDTVQGAYVRLAPVPGMLQKGMCTENGSVVDILCPQAEMPEAECRAHRMTGPRAGERCMGFEPQSSTFSTGHFLPAFSIGNTDVYAGPPGGPCTGYRVDGVRAAGRVVCYR